MVSMIGYDLTRTIAQAQVGDHRAFDAIYDRFADRLFRFLCARCGSQALAEELNGDLWVRVVEHLPEFRFLPGDQEAPFSAWLFQIARNLVADHFRGKGHASLPLVVTLSSRDVPPDEQVITDEAHQELRSALARLTDEQREVVLLRFIEEHSTAEVARLTGRSVNAVKVMQHRALNTLARILGRRRRQGTP